MTTPLAETGNFVIRDPLTNNLVRSYVQDGDKWMWTWVDTVIAAKTFPRDEAERIVRESGQIMLRVEEPQIAYRAIMQARPQEEIQRQPPAPAPAPPARIQVKPPEPKPMEYMLVPVVSRGPDNEVTARMGSGWRLYGPPFVLGEVVYQAMVREIPSP